MIYTFETVLADEDDEQDADRWVSHTAWGQECFQILAQWLWNLRLELGQHLTPAVVRTTVFAPAHAVSPTAPSEPATPVIYGPAQWAKRSFTGGFPGSAFTLQPDGTLRCPADKPLYAQERRPEHDGSLRVLYAGRIGFCRSCPLRQQCQEHPSAKKRIASRKIFVPPLLSSHCLSFCFCVLSEARALSDLCWVTRNGCAILCVPTTIFREANSGGVSVVVTSRSCTRWFQGRHVWQQD